MSIRYPTPSMIPGTIAAFASTLPARHLAHELAGFRALRTEVLGSTWRSGAPSVHMIS